MAKLFTNVNAFKIYVDGIIRTVLMIYENPERVKGEKAIGWLYTTDGINVSIEYFGKRVEFDENAAKAAVLATHKNPMVQPLKPR